MAAGNGQLMAAAPDCGSRPLRRAGLPATMLESYCLLWLGTLLAAVLAIPIAGYLRRRLRLSPDARPARQREHGCADRRQQRPCGSDPALLCVSSEIGTRRWLVIVGDVVVGASLAANVALGGLALGA